MSSSPTQELTEVKHLARLNEGGGGVGERERVSPKEMGKKGWREIHRDMHEVLSLQRHYVSADMADQKHRRDHVDLFMSPYGRLLLYNHTPALPQVHQLMALRHAVVIHHHLHTAVSALDNCS
ncbi:hypothetical protein CRENBAI_009305 [Crenichthys baileyi]|uniref:Uncharacterized protein n=1 Tax=Crenichthys baileyi TaxID=28760 RepID=A0AAV9SJU8_9TELE